MDKQYNIYSVDFNAFYSEKERDINKRKNNVCNEMHLIEGYYKFLTKCKLSEEDICIEDYRNNRDNKEYMSKYYERYKGEYNKLKKELRSLTSSERKAEIKFKTIRENKEAKRKATSNERYKELVKEKGDLKRELKEEINNFKSKDIRVLNRDYLIEKNKISLFDNALGRVMGVKENELSEDIICITITHYEIMEQIISNGFLLDGEKYVMLTSSAGQIRKKKVLFIKESVFNKYSEKIMCGLSIEKINEMGGMNINKFLAYLALQNSATDVLEGFDIDKTIVIDDFETVLKDRKVNYIEKYKKEVVDTKTGEVEEKLFIKEPVEEIRDVLIPHSDGIGLHMFKTKKSFQIRLPFVKGLMTYANWKMFIDETEGASPIIKDLWGKEHNVIEEDIQFIFTKSQFKMWKYYKDWEEYKGHFKRLQCEASYCNKEEDKKDFKKGRFNYQYWQSLTDVKDEEIKHFTEPIVDMINKCHYDVKTMLTVFGANKENNRKNIEQKILAKYPALLKDSHFQDSLSDKLCKIKKNGKSGKFLVDSINTFLLVDVYAFMQHIFCGIEQPEGLLKDGEVSCRYFDCDELLLDRSPHLYREHAVRKNINEGNCKDERKELMKKYFISNGIYTSTHDLITKILMFDKQMSTYIEIYSE